MKKYFENPVYQNVSLILEAIQCNISTSWPKFISRNLYLKKVYGDKTKGKLKFLLDATCIFEA